MPSNDLEPALEALLFAAHEPVTSKDLATILEVDEKEIPDIVEGLRKRLEGRGIGVVEYAGGYQLATRPEYAEYVRRLVEPEPWRLSRAALETLTIVAYRQPVTRPEIDALRGVDSSYVLSMLAERGLIRVAGRKDAPGRPLLFETTPEFLSAFGLKSLDDLPMLDPLQQAAERQLRLSAEGDTSVLWGKGQESTAEDDAV